MPPLPNPPLSSLPIVVFDTETTGLFTMSAWMVEIAGVRMSGSFVTTGVFQTLVRPDAIIPPDATKVHGITDDEVRDAPPTADVLRAFFDWATTGKALNDSGAPFRSIDDMLGDLGFEPEVDEGGKPILLDVPPLPPLERTTPEIEKALRERAFEAQRLSELEDTDSPENPDSDAAPESQFIFEREGGVLFRRKRSPDSEPKPPKEPWANKLAPPGVPIDVPWMQTGSEWDIIHGVYPKVDGVKRFIKGVRDFPHLRGEKPACEPLKPLHPPRMQPPPTPSSELHMRTRPQVVFAAHNAPYDLGILATAFRRTGLTPPAEFICIDTCAWARQALKLNSHSLESVVEHIAEQSKIEIPFMDVDAPDCLGVEAAMFAMQGFHRALSDAFHTAVVLSYLMQVTGIDRDGSTLADLSARYPKSVVCGIPDQSAEVAIPTYLSALTAAIARGADIAISYAGGTSGPRKRKIKPLGFYSSRGVAYLEAFCYIDGFVKTFRVDRIREARKA
ncbi:WYL domain-containing protein [bacterium]|nr:WYL domain-containing protein [bacterium]